MVFSLAKKLVISATMSCHWPRPISAPTGSSARPKVASTLCSMPRPGRVDSAHTTIEAIRISVPAFLMKLTVLFLT